MNNRIITLSLACAALLLCGAASRAGGFPDGRQDGGAPDGGPAWNFPAKEDLPPIAELPDPFLGPDGTRVQTPAQWPAQREYLKAMLAHYMYGIMPEAPHNTVGEVLYTRSLYGGRAIAETVRITFGPDDRPDVKVSFIAQVTRPNIPDRVPVITWNQFSNIYDGCPIEEELVCDRHYAVIEFDREELASDSVHALEGPLAKAYPGYGWGCIAMWAWGHSRLVDYLAATDYADMDRIVATGHSRGGKAALCAAIYDERIALCAVNGSGCGGAGCLRFLGSRLGEGYGSCETAGWIYDRFPFWWADEFGRYGRRQTGLNHDNMTEADLDVIYASMVRPWAADEPGDEDLLPFDLHFVRALVAPRALITTEQLAESWANPYGSQITWAASDEVFQFLGAKGRNALHIREGAHMYTAEDWEVVADFCDSVFYGKKPRSEYLVNPALKDPCKMMGDAASMHFSWKRPSAE